MRFGALKRARMLLSVRFCLNFNNRLGSIPLYKGMQLIALKMASASDEILGQHYEALSDKPFYADLLAYVSSGPVVCMVWRGREAVKEARRLIGATDPGKAEMGSIRGDYGQVSGRNVIHGADSVESASREIALWFEDEAGLVQWEPSLEPWIVPNE